MCVLAFAASGKPLDAVFALSPGHTPDLGEFRKSLAPNVAKARAMIESGNGKDRAWFEDQNQGRVQASACSAESYFCAQRALPGALRIRLPYLLPAGARMRLACFHTLPGITPKD